MRQQSAQDQRPSRRKTNTQRSRVGAPAGNPEQTEQPNFSVQISKPTLEHRKQKSNETQFYLPTANKAQIFQIEYHDGTPVKGGTAVALRPKALDGKTRKQLSLCFYDDTELSEKALAH